MTIRVDNFHGIQPRLHPTLLADGMAVTAHNCRLKNGKLVPLKEPSIEKLAPNLFEGGLKKIQDAMSMHAWKRSDGKIDILLFGGITWMAEGNIADDEKTRVIVSGDTGVSFTDANGDVHENVPAFWMREQVGNGGERIARVPLAKNALPAPKVSRADGSPELTANKRYAHFFWTWVDKYGYESPASPPSMIETGTDTWESDVIEYDDGDRIVFEALGAANWPEGAEALRVYKTAAGTSEQTDGIQFVEEISKARNVLQGDEPGSAGFEIKILDDMLGEAIPNIKAPPFDLRCIQAVPGGFYVGFSPSNPKTVYFSDIGLVYSWPVEYRYDVGDNIVALAVTSNTVYALTDGWPYVLSGTAPESMSVAKLAGPAACVSPRAVCVYRNSAYYASNVGLMVIANSADAGTVCANVTEKVFTKEQWLAMNPSSCIMGQYDGALRLFFRDDAGHALPGLTIDLHESADSVTTHDENARCACVDNSTDRLYYVRDEEEVLNG